MNSVSELSSAPAFAEALAPLGGGIVCCTGGGGKTTLLNTLGEYFAARGSRVLLTACTRLLCPPGRARNRLFVCANPNAVPAATEPGLCFAARAPGSANNPDYFEGYAPEAVDGFLRRGVADWIFVESDGAARRPLKAPSDREPVVPSLVRAVVGVCGMSGVGRPLDEGAVFRPAIFSELSGLAMGEPITPEAVARVIGHERGLFKDVPGNAVRLVFLNQADNAEGMEKARSIGAAVAAPGAEGIAGVYAGAAREAGAPCVRLL